jgi:TolA-binding protein
MNIFYKKTVVWCLLLTTLLLFVGCQTTEDIQRDQKIDGINAQLLQAQKLNAETLIKIQEMEEKFSTFNGMMEESAQENKSDKDQTIKVLENKIQTMEELINSNNKVLQQLMKEFEQQKKYIEEVNKTLKKLSASHDSKPKNSSPKVSATIKPTSNLFQQALDLYAAKKYPEAREQFMDLINKNQIKGKKLANAYHHLGLISFQEKKFDSALTYLSKLYTQFPQSEFASNGLLYLGKSFQAKKSPEDAKESYMELINKFPNTSSAKAARELIKSL